MRTLQSPSRRWSFVLLLAALCAILGITQGLAQTAQPAPAGNPQAPTATLHGTEVTDFLATLSANSAGSQSGSGAAGLLPPAPELRQTTANGCTSDYQCLPDKLCCRACGFFGCTLKACLTPVDGHCPAIP
ncbi:MAG TPA: hypothetical protein VF173_22180 [Thermoanaerobaculia bacterium]|nr:hypothetical protein [Thermoanaerobaculia bacterium]